MPRYVVEFESDRAEVRNRVTTFFRLLLVIPHLLALVVVAIAAVVTVVVAWFALLFTGRMPQGIYTFLLGFLTWCVQVGGYMALLTDRYPPFGLGERDYPIRVVAPARPSEPQNRVKVFFRAILAIPWSIVSNAYGYVGVLASIGSWFTIVFTGRQPDFLRKGVNMGLAAQVHYNAFVGLLAEEWPPFEPELRLEPRAQSAVGPGEGAGPEVPAFSGA